MSIPRVAKPRKKTRRLGKVDVISRKRYGELELDAKVELIRSLVPLGLIHAQELLNQEVLVLTGAWYSRKDESTPGRRHGNNPGSEFPSRFPRVREASAAKLRAFKELALSEDDYVAVFLDGKTFADETMVLAMGVTISGEKKFFGFVETDKDNERVLTPFRRRPVREGLEETLTLHRLGLYALLGRSFKKRRTAWSRLTRWSKNGAPRSTLGNTPISDTAGWLRPCSTSSPDSAASKAYRHLPHLRQALRRALELEENNANQEAACPINKPWRFST